MTDLTGREVGRFEQIVRTLEHRARNDRQIVVLLDDKTKRLELEIQALRVRLYTTISVVAALGSVLAWALRTFR